MNSDDSLVCVPEPLRANLRQRGFTELTRVQEATFEHGLTGVDLRITSETGSGKTVALGLVIAHGWNGEPALQGPRALVITPTRELAMQVQRELTWLFQGLQNAEVALVTGGTSIGRERQQLSRHPGVLVGTPGRLRDHLRSGALSCAAIEQVVLDEADQMLDMGFREDLEAILEQTPQERATHLVSATFAREVARLASRYQKGEFHHVQGTALGEANADIKHTAHVVYPRQRYAALINILLMARDDRTLVFVRTRNDTTDLAELLSEDGFSAQALSGDLPQAQRTRTLARFRSGAISVLVATDVAARGLDVPNIGTVIHFEVPNDADTYTHRSGRTGRAGSEGRSVTLVPIAMRFRFNELLRRARVQAEWVPLPSAAQVQKFSRKASRKQLHDILADEGRWQSQLEYAEKLLSEQNPKHLVAALLEMSLPKLAAEPRELYVPEARDDRPPPRGGRPPRPRPDHARSHDAPIGGNEGWHRARRPYPKKGPPPAHGASAPRSHGAHVGGDEGWHRSARKPSPTAAEPRPRRIVRPKPKLRGDAKG